RWSPPCAAECPSGAASAERRCPGDRTSVPTAAVRRAIIRRSSAPSAGARSRATPVSARAAALPPETRAPNGKRATTAIPLRRPVAAPDACFTCGTPAEPGQEYCLQCGGRIVPARRFSAVGRAWERRFGRYPGDWVLASLLLLLVAA